MIKVNRRIGIYPGTFDPLHQGHLAFCLEAIKRGDVDEVVLLPEPSPRGKPDATMIDERYTLLEAATAQFPLIHVVSLTSDRFTIQQTLPELHARFKGEQLSLLIGSDIVSSLSYWDNLADLLSDLPLVIGLRETDDKGTIENELQQIEQTQNVAIEYHLIQTAHAHVASSHIRSGKMVLNLQAIMDM